MVERPDIDFDNLFDFDVPVMEPQVSYVHNSSDIKVEVYLTNRSYEKKPDYTMIPRIYLKKVSLIPEELYNKVINGHGYMHIFLPVDGDLTKNGLITKKSGRNQTFMCAWLFSIDIDETSYKSLVEFISKLSNKPTFWYNSYSATEDKVKGRLVYVLDKPITNLHQYRFLCGKFSNMIEKETNEELKDRCGDSPVQYFNGTYNKESGYIGDILNIDFLWDEEEYKNFLYNNAGYASSHKWNEDNFLIYKKECDAFGVSCDKEEQTPELTFPIKEYRLMDPLWHAIFHSFDRIKHNLNTECPAWRRQYVDYDDLTLFNTGEEVSPNKVKVTDNTFRMSYFTGIKEEMKDSYGNTLKDIKGKTLYSYRKMRDGDCRKKELMQRAYIRFRMIPNITPDQLMFCLIHDFCQIVDQQDNRDITSAWLKKTVNKVLSTPHDYVIQVTQDLYEWLVTQYKSKKKKDTVQLMSWDKYLDKVYNSQKSVEENWDDIQKSGCEVKRSTFDKWRSKRGYLTDGENNKETVMRCMIEIWDESKHFDENYDALEDFVRNLNVIINRTMVRKCCKELNLTWDETHKPHKPHKPHKDKIPDEEIMEMLDLTLSRNKNYELLKSKGYPVRKQRVFELYNLKEKNN